MSQLVFLSLNSTVYLLLSSENLKASSMANTRNMRRKRKDRRQTLKEESSISNKSNFKPLEFRGSSLLFKCKVKTPSNRQFNNNNILGQSTNHYNLSHLTTHLTVI